MVSGSALGSLFFEANMQREVVDEVPGGDTLTEGTPWAALILLRVNLALPSFSEVIES